MDSDPRIVVLGAGSAGSRHVRNLAELGVAVSVMDPDASRAQSLEDATALPFDLDRLGSFDGVVVASPTSLHREQVLAARAAGAAVLVEKPLATSAVGIEEVVEIAADRCTVGYNLRFHPPVRRVRELVDGGEAGAVTRVRFWFGSHLADWRPSVDYRSTYSAQAALGGGILLDASHEIDLLLWLFGPEWSVERARVEHRSDLDTDVEDTVLATLRSPAGIGATVDLDAVSRPYRRGIEIVGERASIALDWATGELTIADPSDSEPEGVVERADDDIAESYRAEARAFVALLEGGPPAVPAQEGAAVVRLCDEIRRVAAS